MQPEQTLIRQHSLQRLIMVHAVCWAFSMNVRHKLSLNTPGWLCITLGHYSMILSLLLYDLVTASPWSVSVTIQTVLVQLYSQDQDQDSLLVKRRNDNHSPGPVIRELVPSSHQRSELSNTILCIFSGWDQRIGEGISIPDSLGEEATFINIWIGNGSLKCHRVLIPITPSFGDKVICWYTGFTFKTFI